MDELNKRVVKVMEHFSISKSDFALKLGIGLPTIAHIFSGRNKPGVDILQKILLTYPSINATWLMLGNGEMIVTQKPSLNIDNELINLKKLIDNISKFHQNTDQVIAYHKLLFDELRYISELDTLLTNTQSDLTEIQQNMKDELENLQFKVIK